MRNLTLLLILSLTQMMFGQTYFTTQNVKKAYHKSGYEEELFEKKSETSFSINKNFSSIEISGEIEELNGTHTLTLVDATTTPDGIYVTALLKIRDVPYDINIEGSQMTLWVSKHTNEPHNSWSFFTYFYLQIEN